MPTTAAVLKSLKAPVSRLLSTYSRGTQSYTRSKDSNGHVRIGSVPDIREEYDRKLGGRGRETSKALFVAARNPGNGEQMAQEEDSIYPLEETHVGKTAVTRKFDSQLPKREEEWR